MSSQNAGLIPRDQTTDPTRKGMLQSVQTRAGRHGEPPAYSKGGDGDPAVRARYRGLFGQEHFAELRTAHHNSSYGSLGSRADYAPTASFMSYAKALKKAQQGESVEGTICKRGVLFAGAVQRTTNERLIRRVTFRTKAGGENPGPVLTRVQLGPISSRRPQGF